MQYLLLATLGLPFLGAGLMWILAPIGAHVVRWTALGVTLLTLVGAALLVGQFPADGSGGDHFVSALRLGTSPFLDVRFQVALDGLSLWLFALSAVLAVTSVLVSWTAIRDRVALFYGMLLLLTGGCLGVFAARDIILFYVFFEFTLIPLFFLIGIWGSEERRYAAIKFFLYTLAGSLLTFLGLLTIVLWDYSQSDLGMLRFNIPLLTESLQTHRLPLAGQWWIFLALFIGFAIKVPLFPLHTWLPLAHVQAPTAGSVFLAGLLLKIGTYGFLRFNVPMLPEATVMAMPWILWLAVIGIIYGALVALVQTDMKRLIAYSSVSHLGYCMLGIFALNRLGLEGATLQMINHGISTGALFAIVGMIYERYHTRQIAAFGGLARRAPWLAFCMLLFTFSSIGLPGLNGFPGEFMVLLGTFQRAFAEAAGPGAIQLRVIAVLAVSGVVLGAWYMLWLVQRVFFGPLREPTDEHGEHGPAAHEPGAVHAGSDMNWREVLALAPLAVLVFWIGLYPKYFLDRMGPSLVQAAAVTEEPVRARYAPEELRAEVDAAPQLEKLSRVD